MVLCKVFLYAVILICVLIEALEARHIKKWTKNKGKILPNTLTAIFSYKTILYCHIYKIISVFAN